MRRVIVQYQVREERIAEHEALIHAVFDELAKTAPPGIRYGAFRRPDGASFVHIAFVEAKQNPLDAVVAFKAFVARIGERCVQPPEVIDLVEIGAYGL